MISTSELFDIGSGIKRICEENKVYLDALVKKDAEIERLREALKPFADVVKGNWDEQPDMMPMSYGFGSDKRFDLTLGDFRKARAALKGDE